MAKQPQTAISPTRAENYPEWYQQVVKAADLAEPSDVRGCMVIKPWGYAIWENIQRRLDAMFKATGHENAYFPLFIPMSFLEKEAQHVEGFAKECAVVTHHRLEPDGKGGLRPAPDSKLEEPLIVRPTSETIIGATFARWVQSYRDLPILINQWANVVRWELRTRMFLRTTEFLWQEGHTAHETAEEAESETRMILDLYASLCESLLAMPVVKGIKSESEKFAGALRTYSIEALMGDGRALQAGTSHNLGQNFAKAFDITFQARDKSVQHVWGTSWGVTTRLVGAVIMTHGDDSGLVLPPRVAPYQVVVVPIGRENWRETVLPHALEVKRALVAAGVRVVLDDREERPGWKFSEWELRGVPLRLEIGPKDIEKSQVLLACRDTREKSTAPLDGLAAHVTALLEVIQGRLLARAKAFREERTATVATREEFDRLMDGRPGFVIAGWCGNASCEATIKAETQATIRNMPLDAPPATGACICCGRPAVAQAWFAKAY